MCECKYAYVQDNLLYMMYANVHVYVYNCLMMCCVMLCHVMLRTNGCMYGM